ncbi:MAG: trypsin-like peptidase domain-containing protein [Planctomycetota bacterium]
MSCVLWTLALPLAAQGKGNATLLRADAGGPAVATGPAALVEKVRRSVVHVVVEVDGPRGTFPIVRSSSGVIVDPKGLVVTFRHLVQEAQGATDKRIFVQLDDAANTRLPASIESIDAATGLALLKVTPPNGALAAAPLATGRPRIGEPVVVLTRPEGKEMLAFAGVASNASSGLSVGGARFSAEQVFLCDSRNDERCDGGPAFDSNGHVLGLYAGEHVQRDVSDPKLEDLMKPSFGVLVAATVVSQAFLGKFEGPEASPGAVHPQAAAVAAVAPSVVTVWASEGDFPVAGPLDPGGVVRVKGLGSGVVIAGKGLVVCNAHVAKASTPRVRMPDGAIYSASVLDTSSAVNLALLQVELPAGVTLPAASCNANDDVEVGEVVLAVGNPYGVPVVTAGVVSAKRDREGGRIQADANLGNQNGGGAVVDVHGHVLGISDAGAIDPIEMMFAQRGDRMSTETNLSTFVGIARVRRAFAEQIEDVAGASESIRAAAVDPQRKESRRTALSKMVEQQAKAMLNIYVARDVTEVDEDDPFASMKERTFVPMSLGSGVIIDSSGLALSNWHVVDDATRPDGSMVADHQVTARVFGGKEYRVKVLSISREDDLSLLQLELEAGETVHAVELGSSESLALGEWVAAIGNPHGRANTVTFGIVSAKDQSINVKGRFEKLGPLVETDAAINGGNSGGALLDMRGRLVGINSAGGGTFNNKGYAIEVDHVRKQVLTLLLQAYKLRSPDLGMRVLDEDGKVLVLDCDPRGPAARAGVRSGDLIVSLDGTAIEWSPAFALRLRDATPGVEVELKIERAGEAKTFRIAPFAPEVFSVLRQSGLQVRDFEFAEDEERMRAAAIALHRQFSGDANGEPQQIQESAVMVVHYHPGEQKDGVDVVAGDLVLAMEFTSQDGDPVLKRIEDVAALRDLWNDRELGSYDGVPWRVWIARGTEVKAVEWTAKRLFW